MGDAPGWRFVVLGIEGYEPHWQHSAEALAAAHRARFARIIGHPLVGAWLMWDLDEDRWFADGPVVLGFGEANVEITHRKFDECAITWDQVDMASPVDWYGTGLRLDWVPTGHATLRAVAGRRLREVNVIERITTARWRPNVLSAIEFQFDGARLAVYNALDENGLTDDDEVDLPIGFWRRIRVA
ncbi:MAG TPA: hypothetical protein VHI50_08630 [Micromonosporaceae bacterium]|jgi:hypothetical protein|nr:hypothetical protein [Micromonosporaceae bacterium]